MKKPKGIGSYLASVPPTQRAALQKLRAQIKSAAPGAVECIGGGFPAFKYKGKYVAGFAAYKSHCSLAPFSSLRKLVDAKELAKYDCTEGMVRFTVKKMLPALFVRKLVQAKVKMINEGKARM